jgi:5-methylcytosine-specific restriction endonuclease McrA
MPIIRSGYATQTRNGSTRAYRKQRAIALAMAYHCALCGKPPTPTDPLVADHIVAHAYGGSDHASNLRAVHRLCNARRGTGGGV